MVKALEKLVGHGHGHSHSHADHMHSHDSTLVQWLFARLFPFGPAANSVLATTYISGLPNLALVFMPPIVNPTALAVMVGFAVGGLLGDVFMHLLPHTFLGDAHDGGVRFVLVDERRATVLGMAIFGGFFAFVLLDQVLRYMGGHDHDHDHDHNHDHDHGHSHSHSHSGSSGADSSPEHAHSHSTATKTGATELRRRGAEKEPLPEPESSPEHTAADSGPSSSAVLAAWLNLVADFSHNLTDGIALASAFFISTQAGATSCLALFCHEVPHQFGDFALLIKGGFSKPKALRAQFATALGAYAGSAAGIALNTWAASSSADPLANGAAAGGILGTNVQLRELVQPATAGGFIYIATVGIIPDMLRSHPPPLTAFFQFVAVLVGFAVMLAVAWNE